MSISSFMPWLRENWPHPPDHVLARLRHTLDVCDHPELGTPEPDDKLVLEATSGVYRDHRGQPVRTGITYGDLRLIRAYLERMWEIEGERPMAPILNIPLDNFGPTPRPTIR